MNLIAAVDRNWGLGKDGDQLVYIPEDLKRFRKLTEGHAVVLGRKTLATFPGGRPLKGRRNLILSRNPEFCPRGAEVFSSLEALLPEIPEDAFVIGGASVYRELLPWCDTAYITEIDGTWPADCFLPCLARDPDWERAETSEVQEYGDLKYRYVTYRRRVRETAPQTE